MTRGWTAAVVLWGLAVSGAAAAAAPFAFEAGPAPAAGARLMLAPREGRSASLRVVFSAGRVDEEDVPGVLRMAQHALVEASAERRYEDHALAVFHAAASSGFTAGVSESAFTFTANRSDFDALAPGLLSRLLCPRLSPAAFEGARERTLQDGWWVTDVPYVERVLSRGLLSDPRFTRPYVPSRTVLEDLTLAEVQRFARTHLAPARATVIAAGSFDARRLRRVVAGCRGGSRADAPPPALELPATVTAHAAAGLQVFAYPVTVTSARSAAGLRVLASVLEERLERTVRSEGLAYVLPVELLFRKELDALVVTVPVAGMAGVRLVHRLRADVERLATEPVPEEELGRHRRALLTSLRLDDASPEALASALAVEASRPGWYGPRLVEELEALTAEGLREVVAPWLKQERRITVSLGRDHGAPKRVPGP